MREVKTDYGFVVRVENWMTAPGFEHFDLGGARIVSMHLVERSPCDRICFEIFIRHKEVKKHRIWCWRLLLAKSLAESLV